MEEKNIISFFEDFSQEKMAAFHALPQSGSSRKNYVFRDSKQKYILTYNCNIAENKAFIYFSDLFSGLDLNTPKIFKINSDEDLYIQSFLGKETLSEIIVKEGESERVIGLVKNTLTQLFKLQTSTKNKVDYSKTFEYRSYDQLPILNDLFYFKNFFVDVLEIPYQKSALISEFLELVELIEKLAPKGLMLRDFQSRNIMVNDLDDIFFIDYQAAMEGPLIYDVISFLYQAKANFSDELKTKMLDFYINLFDDETEKSDLKKSVELIKLMRFLQVLGAYGFRGMVQKKEHFIQSIPKGVENIQTFAKSWSEIKNFPELQKLILNLNIKRN